MVVFPFSSTPISLRFAQQVVVIISDRNQLPYWKPLWKRFLHRKRIVKLPRFFFVHKLFFISGCFGSFSVKWETKKNRWYTQPHTYIYMQKMPKEELWPTCSFNLNIKKRRKKICMVNNSAKGDAAPMTTKRLQQCVTSSQGREPLWWYSIIFMIFGKRD